MENNKGQKNLWYVILNNTPENKNLILAENKKSKENLKKNDFCFCVFNEQSH